MKENIRKVCIESQSSILSALKQMDAVKHRLLIVTDDGRFRSMLSIRMRK